MRRRGYNPILIFVSERITHQRVKGIYPSVPNTQYQQVSGYGYSRIAFPSDVDITSNWPIDSSFRRNRITPLYPSQAHMIDLWNPLKKAHDSLYLEAATITISKF